MSLTGIKLRIQEQPMSRERIGRIVLSVLLVVLVVCLSVLAEFLWLRYHATARNAPAQTPVPAEDPARSLKQKVDSLPQPFSRLLFSMHQHEQQLGTDGVRHTLTRDDGITANDGVYIYKLVRQTHPHRTMEVGLGEGFSTMYFLAALQSDPGATHVAMDPYEVSGYHGIGLEKVKEAGVKKQFRFMPAKSIAAIPQLSAEGKPYEIIFIDGDHRFDAAFTDFVMSDSLCPAGGYILFHDVWMGSTKKIISFLEHNRSDYARRPVPGGVNMAVFQKVGKDQRPWQHFADF